MPFDIYLCGVGGQGIGLLAATLAQAADRAGLPTLACDTHGLAQRGGVVSSQIRLGDGPLTPLIPERGADLVLALERLEALRGATLFLKPGGRLVYFDTAYQPLGVRTGAAGYPAAEEVERAVAAFGGTVVRVPPDAAPDPRMQNAALLGRLAGLDAIPGLSPDMIEATLGELVPQKLLGRNLEVFRQAKEGG